MDIRKAIISSLLLTAALTDLPAEDIWRTDTLETAFITAEKGLAVTRTDTVNLAAVPDASMTLHGIPGLTMTDTGGPSGLKTISLRGLGAAHTGVYIDGIRVSNLQSGQTDLSMAGLNGYSHIIIDYAQNSINFITARPDFSARKIVGRALMQAGSFGTYQPYAGIGWKATPDLSLSIYAEGNISKGNFPYHSGEESLRRNNNDIRQFRTGVDLFGSLSGGEWHLKAYLNNAGRGTPGPVTWLSEDRQKDMNTFIQADIRNSFSNRYILKAGAKIYHDNLEYLSSYGNSIFRQSGAQLNTSHTYRLRDWWNISLALGMTWDRLSSESYTESVLTRTGVLAAVSTSIRTGGFRTDIAAEYTGASDKSWKDALSPSVRLSYMFSWGLEISATARRAYRIPTFNELYYVGFGNPDLRNEDAWLTDVGIRFDRRTASGWKFTAKADGFANWLRDKIISVPSVENPAIWFPHNIGKARIYGADISAGSHFDHNCWHAGFTCGYVFMDALDMTPGSGQYGQMIPYIARHTAVAKAEASFKGWRITFIWNMRNGLRDNSGSIPDWNTLDLIADKETAVSSRLGVSVRVFAMLNNFTDCRYELSGGYPMPGRNWKAGIEVKF